MSFSATREFLQKRRRADSLRLTSPEYSERNPYSILSLKCKHEDKIIQFMTFIANYILILLTNLEFYRIIVLKNEVLPSTYFIRAITTESLGFGKSNSTS